MRTEQVAIYKFSELDEDAQQLAMDKYAEHSGYLWQDEAFDSISALAEHFNSNISDYSIDYFDSCHSSMTFDVADMDEDEIAERLNKLGTYDAGTLRGHGDCLLTGYCMDEDAIDGFRKAWHNGERDLGELLQVAFDNWIKSAQADCRDFYSVQQFAEHADANGYEYYECGRMA
jgi:hypothetical protein